MEPYLTATEVSLAMASHSVISRPTQVSTCCFNPKPQPDRLVLNL